MPTGQTSDPSMAFDMPDQPPIEAGYKRVYTDIPIAPLPPKPAIDNAWSDARYVTTKVDERATDLYALCDSLILDIKRNDGSFAPAPDYSEDYPVAPAVDLEAAHNAQMKYNAVQSALANLRAAANHLRDATLALYPYLTDEYKKRGY